METTEALLAQESDLALWTRPDGGKVHSEAFVGYIYPQSGSLAVQQCLVYAVKTHVD